MDATRYATGGETRGSDEVREPLLRTLPATVENASRLRRELRSWLVVDVDEDVSDDLLLAVYEAVANAVEHAYRGRLGPMRVEARRTAVEVVVEVTDQGTWRSGPRGAYRGRGIALMHQLADGAYLDSTDRGTTVRLRVAATVQQKNGVSALTR